MSNKNIDIGKGAEHMSEPRNFFVFVMHFVVSLHFFFWAIFEISLLAFVFLLSWMSSLTCAYYSVVCYFLGLLCSRFPLYISHGNVLFKFYSWESRKNVGENGAERGRGDFFAGPNVHCNPIMNLVFKVLVLFFFFSRFKAISWLNNIVFVNSYYFQ